MIVPGLPHGLRAGAGPRRPYSAESHCTPCRSRSGRAAPWSRWRADGEASAGHPAEMRPSPPPVLHDPLTARPRAGESLRGATTAVHGLLCLLLVAWIASAPGSAAAFGTIDSGGQHREHERITRAALACAGDAGPSRTASSRGPSTTSPDTTASSAPSARLTTTSCPTRPRTATTPTSSRAAIRVPATQATASLMDCVNQLRARFGEGVDSAQGLLDDQGQVIAGEVNLDPECRPARSARRTAPSARPWKGSGGSCTGRRTSTRTATGPTRRTRPVPIGDENPPGLNLPGPSPVLDLRTETPPSVPAGPHDRLLRAEGRGPRRRCLCARGSPMPRSTRTAGLIDPVTGRATDPTTPRGMVGDNFAKAVSGAIAESRRQWQDFRSELTARYGKDKGRAHDLRAHPRRSGERLPGPSGAASSSLSCSPAASSRPPRRSCC